MVDSVYVRARRQAVYARRNFCQVVIAYPLARPYRIIKPLTEDLADIVRAEHLADFRDDEGQMHNQTVVAWAKPRLALVISPDTLNLHEHIDTVVVVPVFSFHDDGTRWSPTTRDRIRTGQFPNRFYLPPSETHGLRESCAFLDHLQPVLKASVERKNVALSERAFDELMERLRAYFGEM